MGEFQMRNAAGDGGADTACAEPATRRPAKAAAAVACLLVVAGCAGGYAKYTPLVQYAAATRIADDAGAPVEIRGHCYNACVVQLAAGNVYVDPDALFSAHVAWPGYRSDERLTSAAYRVVPACARTVLDQRRRSPFDPMARVYGSQILAACPDMKPLSSL